MKQIKLSNGYFAKVDDEDFEYLIQFNWYAQRIGNIYYATRAIDRSRRVRMHRDVTRALKNEKVDHIDHDGLNNQKNNLRKCTHAQNMKNSRPALNKTSKYLGVHFAKTRNKWVASICINYKGKFLGSFINEIDAAKAYDEAAKIYHKEFANLNFK